MQVIDEKGAQQSFPVAIIVSRFNEEVGRHLLQGALTRLQEFCFSEELIKVIWVPGAVEIPIVAQQLAKTEQYKAIITLGTVIQGETRHFDYVCEQVSQGCQRVALDTQTPIIFGVLTTDDKAQAMDRVGGKHGHKGRDAVDCACEMVALLQQL